MRVYNANDGRARPDREERVRLADMLRGKDTVAGLKLPEVKKAIGRTRRRKPTNETTRAPRWSR